MGGKVCRPAFSRRLQKCWICGRALTITDPEDDTACARADCITGMNSGSMDGVEEED